MSDKPNNIHVSSFFLKKGGDKKEAKEDISKACCHIYRKGRETLGKYVLFLWILIFGGYKKTQFS